MARHSKKEFAQLCKQETKYLSVQISRGKVYVENDEIDDKHPTNKAYLEKIYGRMDFVPKDQPEQQKKHSPSTDAVTSKLSDLSDDDIKAALENTKGMDYPTLERLYKYLQGEKLKGDIEKNKIDIEKKRGEVIPVSPIESLVYQALQYVLTQMKIAYEKSLIEIAHKYEIPAEDIAAYRGNNITLLNNAVASANSLFIGDLGKNLSAFTVKKSIGEHG